MDKNSTDYTTRLDRRIATIAESMIRGGCKSAAVEHAQQVLHVLDEIQAQGLVMYGGGVAAIVPIANAIRKSQLPVIYLVTCDLEAFDEKESMMATYKHRYIFIRNIKVPLLEMRDSRESPGINIYKVVRD